MAIVVGATLGIAGTEMQTILDNPLASPYTLGISAGAGFGAALAMAARFADEIVVLSDGEVYATGQPVQY